MTKDIQDSKSEPDKQQDIIDFVLNPETMKKAAEGSMEKRRKVLDMPDDKELSEILARLVLDPMEESTPDAREEAGKRAFTVGQAEQALLAWRERAVLRGKIEALNIFDEYGGEAMMIEFLKDELKKLEEK